MSALIGRSSRRFLLRHPWQLVLALAGIAGGVAVVVGVDLANESALRALTRSSELVAGRATHQLLGIGGRIPESLLVRLRTELGLRAAPVIESGARLADGAPVTLAGVDPLADVALQGKPADGEASSWPRLLAEPRTVVLPRSLAARLSLEPGDALTLDIGGRPVALDVVGLVTPEADELAAAADFVIADIATAQELLGYEGELSRIDLVLSEPQARALARADLGAVELVPAGARNRALVEMTRAFRVNLTALSLLALLVGAFLIHNTVAFLALRRRRLFGLLRSLGATRRQLFRLVLGEGFALGLAGSLAGLALGALLGHGLVRLVARTIDDLYFDLGVVPLAIGAFALAKGLALGVGVSLLAAWLPAREAAASPPRAVLSRASMEARARGRLRFLPALSALAALLGALALALPGRSLTAAFFGLFCIIAAAALATPVVTVILMSAARRVLGRTRGVAGRFAARSVVAGLSRTGTAVSALAMAVAAVIGIGLMIASFRASVIEWLDTALRADLFVSAEASTGLDDALAARIGALPGVSAVSATRRARVPVAAGVLNLWGIEPGRTAWRLQLVQGDAAAVWPRVLAGDAVLVSEPYAARHGVAAGDTVNLPGPQGERRWPVAGVFVDYTTDQGVVALALDAYRTHYGDHALTGIGVYLDAAAPPDAVRAAIAGLIAGRDGARLASNRELRAASLDIFERTFRVTDVLRYLAGGIALLGIYSALQALALERRREIAVLRAVGFTPAQVRRHILAQTILLGLAAAAVALPLGMALAWLLVHVINERAFGWSMGFELAPAALWEGVALALGAALLAGLRPAFVLAQGPPAAGLREE